MKYVIALVALVGFLGFSSFVHAEDAAKLTPKNGKHAGHFVKVDGKNLVYKGGKKGAGKEYEVATDDKTKVTIDGKEGKLDDIKPDTLIEVTVADKIATVIAATTAPAKPDAKAGETDKK